MVLNILHIFLFHPQSALRENILLRFIDEEAETYGIQVGCSDSDIVSGLIDPRI